MSSPPPPYKSRLFNFVNRNYLKFNSQVNVKIRELGYVVQGGLQTIILPFFWLWETTKKVTKSFVASPQYKTSLPIEETIKNIVNYNNNNDLISVINNAINDNPELPSLPPQHFQGLASRLKDKRLIFILEKNRLKDTIPIKQQSEINLLIHDLADQFTTQKLLSASNNTNFLTKFFAGLNIFGKSTVEDKISQDINNIRSNNLTFINNNNSILIFIDNLLTTLESLAFFAKNKSSIDIQNQEIIGETEQKISILQLIKDAIEYFFYSKNNQLSENNNIANNFLKNNKNKENLSPSDNTIKAIITKSQQTAEKIIPQIQETTEQLINQGFNQINIVKNNLNNKLNNPDDPFQIQVLIWAAINYFFNQKQSSLSTNSKKSFLPSFSATEIILINDEIADPWLSWEDLYNTKQKDTMTNDDSMVSNNISIAPNIKPNNIIIQASETIESINIILESTEITPKISSEENISLDKTPQKATIKKKKKQELLDNQKVIVEQEIEAKVIEIKYEKHFLEIILEKLDQLILWLEETLIKIVNKIKFFTKQFNE